MFKKTRSLYIYLDFFNSLEACIHPPTSWFTKLKVTKSISGQRQKHDGKFLVLVFHSLNLDEFHPTDRSGDTGFSTRNLILQELLF